MHQYATTATQLESVAPTQPGGALDHVAAAAAGGCARARHSRQAGGLLLQDEETSSYWQEVDGEQLLESTSRQTTPAQSRAASPVAAAAVELGGGGCGTQLQAPQQQQESHHAAAEGTPCTEEIMIMRHFPQIAVSERVGTSWGWVCPPATLVKIWVPPHARTPTPPCHAPGRLRAVQGSHAPAGLHPSATPRILCRFRAHGGAGALRVLLSACPADCLHVVKIHTHTHTHDKVTGISSRG